MKIFFSLPLCCMLLVNAYAQSTSPQLVIDKANELAYPGHSSTIYGNGAGNRSQSGAFLNTFIGTSVGNKITSGNSNTIIGNSAGNQLTSGSENIFIGTFSGASNTTGSENIILGALSCTNCDKNLFAGWRGTSDKVFAGNVLIGNGSIRNKTVNFNGNTFLGYGAGGSVDSVSSSIFIGSNAGETARTNGILIGNMAGQSNRGSNALLIGDRAGNINRGSENVFIGHNAGQFSVGSKQSLIIGNDAVNSSTYRANCSTCTVLGNQAGGNFNKGVSNVFVGFAAGMHINEGSGNTFVGTNSGSSTFAGNPNQSDAKVNNNTFLGYLTGITIKEANSNVFLGFEAGRNFAKGNANIFIGSNVSINTRALQPHADSLILIGTNAQSSNDLRNAIAIGNNTRLIASNTMVLGNKELNIGIGTNTPNNKVEIVANADNASGLRLAKLTANTGAAETNGKMLSVNEMGDVILTKTAAVDYNGLFQQIERKLATLEAENGTLKSTLTTAQAAIADLTARLTQLEQAKPRKCCWFCRKK